MIFAKIHITYRDGASRICEAVNKEDLGEQLNHVQNDIFKENVVKAMVESIDPTSSPIAEMFNNMASDLDKLKKTQDILYKSANK